MLFLSPVLFSPSLSTQHPQERQWKNEGFACEILAPLISSLSLSPSLSFPPSLSPSTRAPFSQKYSMKMTAKPRQTSMCARTRVYVFWRRMGFATAVSLGRGNLVAEVEDAPGAFVEGHCPGEPRGRSAVNRTHSRRGRVEQRSFEGRRTTAKG